MKPLLKLLLVTIILTTLSVIHPPPARAEYEGSVLTSLIVGANVLLTDGCPPKDESTDPPLSALWDEQVSLENHILKCSDELVGVGAMRMTKSALASMYMYQPASSQEYLADVGSRIGVTPAYAQQGTGSKSLLPVLMIWRAFRNIAYLLYILMFTIIGLMIMFRSKINPQTIVSIQAALPNLIITLLLITFSYAIAGFLIDLMYWAIYALVALFEAAGILQSGTGTATINDFIFGKNLVQIKTALNGGFLGLGGAKTLLRDTINNIWPSLTFPVYWATVGWLAFNIALLISMLKTVLELIKAYLMVILYVVTAPLQLLVNAMPGSEAFLTWLRCLAGHLAVFPTVAGLLLIGAALIGTAHDSNGTSWWPKTASNIGYSESGLSGFVPPFIFKDGNPGTDGANSNGTQVIQGLLGLAIIFILPAVLEMVKETFQCKTADYGKVIQENFAEGQKWTETGYRRVGGAWQSGYRSYQEETLGTWGSIVDIFRAIFGM